MRDLAAIDRLVAEKVMGWRLDRRSDEWVGRPCPDDIPLAAWTWQPSRNISDAWAVVEKMESLGWSYELWNFGGLGNTTDHCARFEHVNDDDCAKHSCGDPSMPLAICLAALKALGVEVGDE